MDSVQEAYIQVKQVGRYRYEATVTARPDNGGDSPFQMPLMECGAFRARSHRAAWKAWNAVGRPHIVELDEL